MNAIAAKVARAQALISRQVKLDEEKDAVAAELEKLFGTGPGKKRGPKVGSKNKMTKARLAKKAAKKSAAKKTRGRRAKSKDGRSINDVLVQDILPARGKDGMDLSGVMAALKKKGIISTDGSIRQSLLTLATEGLALRPDRGVYTLSAKGEKAKVKAKGGASKKAPKKKKVAKKKTGKKPVKKVAKKKATTKKAAAPAAEAAEPAKAEETSAE